MNKVVMITGGSRGIGKKMVEDFANNGYKVSFSYLNNEDSAKILQESLEKKGCQVIFKKVDISKDDDIKEFIHFTLEKFGKIDILIYSCI